MSRRIKLWISSNHDDFPFTVNGVYKYKSESAKEDYEAVDWEFEEV